MEAQWLNLRNRYYRTLYMVLPLEFVVAAFLMVTVHDWFGLAFIGFAFFHSWEMDERIVCPQCSHPVGKGLVFWKFWGIGEACVSCRWPAAAQQGVPADRPRIRSAGG